MFPARYFPERYFAARYWVSAGPELAVSSSRIIAIAQRSRSITVNDPGRAIDVPPRSRTVSEEI